ncbi:acetyl-CoA carboxylase biotin carboxyl carrier protein [Pseudonocardia adelaidensis]|uniref:Biotin carboxyl carrier protein of acetyl-CoA carboxylase n=1 Tax=Pseudonocardia adelaidensis TaxID=648754 RepID=A0ABP9NIL3_9PSEU
MTDTTGTTNGSVAGALSDADVQQVVRLVESLDRSGFDFLEVQVGELKVTIGKGEPPATAPATAAVPAPAPVPQVAAPSVAPPAVTAPAVAPPAVAPAAPPASAPAAPALREITAPTMGIFYAQPEPGKPPFVTAGTLVEESTTVALVEVMKTFHAVAAGVRGTVVEVCVSDAQFVEFGQVLFRVDPGA